MKTFVAAGLVGLGLVLATSAAQEPKKDAPEEVPKEVPKAAASGEFKDSKQKVSYTIGLDYGRNLKAQAAELDLDIDAALKGMNDALAGSKPLLTEAEMKEAIRELQNKVTAKRAARLNEMKASGPENKKKGDAFLAANKAKEGVKVTKSGLQYKVLKEGTGKSPKLTDTVRVNYKGTLIDGTQFDSSYDRGEPIEFPVDGVIKGWQEGLQLMKEGAKYQFFIPSNLAYDHEPQGPVIGPDSTLVFEVELLKVL